MVKTLKDLNILHQARRKDDNFYYHLFPFEKIEFCWTSQIRQEAIKWIKEDIDYIDKDPINEEDRIPMHHLTEKWIKRFNITEEELKC
jgi:hypothetical protein